LYRGLIFPIKGPDLNSSSQQKKIIMGRGDKKTKKGKIFKGSFGKSRPAKAKKAAPKKSS
jgi:30S ribosomal protein S31